MNTDVTQIPLEEIQARILGGEHFTAEEYRAVIERFRGDRRSAAETSAKSRAKKPAAADFDLFADLNAAMGK